MKRLLFLLLFPLLLATAPAQAQQLAQYSQYMNNNYILNPAVAGTEDYIDVKASTRAQWVGLDGAPRTYYLSANSALGALHTQSKRTLNDWRRGFHAVGGIVYSDVTGPTSRTGVYGSYTYNLPLTRTVRLALGVSVGMQQFAVDGSQLQFYSGTIATSQSSKVPDATVGAWLYSPDFYVGLSSAQILGNQLDLAYSPTNQLVYSNKLSRHYFATGRRAPAPQRRFRAGALGAGQVHVARPRLRRPQREGALQGDTVGPEPRGGPSTRPCLWWASTSAPSASLSYSYDAGLSPLAAYQSGSHEVLLGLKLKKRFKTVCPDRFW